MTDRAEPGLEEIYREVILDHYRNPRNRGALAHADRSADGLNPLCGDEIRVELALDGDTVRAIGFTGRGCSISQASASMMTEAVSGRTIDEAHHLVDAFKAMMTKDEPPAPELGDVDSLSGVAKLPVRVKCATLSWNVLTQALDAP